MYPAFHGDQDAHILKTVDTEERPSQMKLFLEKTFPWKVEIL